MVEGKRRECGEMSVQPQESCGGRSLYLYLRDASRDVFFIPLIVSRALWMRQCGEGEHELESKDGATKATDHVIIL
jgi:hypothetical protein